MRHWSFTRRYTEVAFQRGRRRDQIGSYRLAARTSPELRYGKTEALHVGHSFVGNPPAHDHDREWRIRRRVGHDELGDLPRRRELLLGREAGLRGVVEDGFDPRSFRHLPDLQLYCRVAELVAQYRVPGLRLEGDPGLSHDF